MKRFHFDEPESSATNFNTLAHVMRRRRSDSDASDSDDIDDPTVLHGAAALFSLTTAANLLSQSINSMVTHIRATHSTSTRMNHVQNGVYCGGSMSDDSEDSSDRELGD